tara:strand:- start:1345 stop:2535 length:1191 start_codon:yes stop_codon:yes gene_type:complete
MKILYIHQYFNTPQMPGSTRSYEFAKRLVSRGDTVYMVTTNWQGRANSSYSLVEGIHVYWAPLVYNNKMNYINRIFIFFQFIWYIFSLGQKLNFDLIIASSTPLTIALPSILLKKLKGVKMVFEIRDLWPQLPIAIGAIKSKLIIKLAKWLEKKTYSNSEHIICLSPGMKKELSSIILENKITIVTNLSDVFGFQKKQEESAMEISINKNNPLILYTGSFGRINGVTYLVEIAKEMLKINSDIFFLLAGNGYDKKKIISTSKKYGLYNKTLYCIDYVSKDQIPKLLSRATITTSLFINIPEMENNSANKFFDALAAGKPIMINYGGWQADLIKDIGFGFVIPSNDAINSAKIINKIIRDKAKLNQMSKASINLAKEFDIETNYQKFVGVVDSVMYS